MTRQETCQSVTRQIRTLLPDDLKNIKITVRYFGHRGRVIVPQHNKRGVTIPSMMVEHPDFDLLPSVAAERITTHVASVSLS